MKNPKTRHENRAYFNVAHSEFEDSKGKSHQAIYFDSIREYVSAINYGRDNFGWNAYLNHGDDWLYGDNGNLQETNEALLLGLANPFSIEKVQQIKESLLNTDGVSKLFEQAETKKKKRVFSEEGSELDIDRVMCADPFHWQRTTRGKKNNVVSLAVNVVSAAGNGHDTFYNLTALTLTACDLLEAAGFAVQLKAICGGKKSNSGYVDTAVVCHVKKAEEPLDTERIASIGYPGFMRYYCHSAIPYFFNESGNGGWQCLPLEDEFIRHLDIDHLITLTHCADEGAQTYFLGNLFKKLNDFE